MRKEQSVSVLLDRLIEQTNKKQKVSIDDLLASFGGRATGPILFTLAILLATIGGIPGVSPVLGIIIILVSVQGIFTEHLWLPHWIRTRKVSAAKTRNLLKKVIPWIKKMEKFSRPRWQWLASKPWNYISQAVIALIGMSVLVLTIIPGGLIPPSIAIALLSIARLHHDGVWMGAGLLFSLGSIGLLGFAILK